ncbi:M14 family zinc carboxypeptidase [Psychromicrobium lacuslunae]|uniref:Peptidase M14 domain-containing protein n=1 Tax=Psychromicrobium lacuslunae TaxID=1618207 RepID=A0A0D4BXA3_9MICC|nr:M14 family zinc carboxypeptidase [Psychromicrobium lacuslunae]AJT40755.1 hypothetical protein UM93_03075 [Psychromicrobium lacuslunae]
MKKLPLQLLATAATLTVGLSAMGSAVATEKTLAPTNSDTVVQNIEFRADLSSATVKAALQGYDVEQLSNHTGSLLGTHQTAQKLAAKGIVITKESPYGSDFSAAPEAAATPSPLPNRVKNNSYETYFGGYKTIAAYQKLATDIAAAYPEFAQYVDYGDSWQKAKGQTGHDLFALRITANAQQSSDWQNNTNHKPRFVFSGQIHAREIIGSEFVSRFTADILNGYGTDPEATALLDSTEVWVVFGSNPDGIATVEKGLKTAATTSSGDGNPAANNTAWQRKNMDTDGYTGGSSDYTSSQPGVDLNRNWLTGWGGQGTSTDPSDQSYRGKSALSEPESKQQADFFTQLFGKHPVSNSSPAPSTTQGTVLNLHSYSNLVIYPYAYDNTVIPPNIAAIKNLGFRQSFYNNFATGAAGDVIYNAAGGDIDTIYQQNGVPAYTWEIGTSSQGGFFPAFSRTEGLYNKYRGGIFYTANAAAAPYKTPAGPTVTTLTATRNGDKSVSIKATANDNAFGTNPSNSKPSAQNVTAAEYSIGTLPAAAGNGTSLSLTDGTANSTTESFNGTTAALADGKQTIFVRTKDADGNWGPAKAIFVS